MRSLHSTVMVAAMCGVVFSCLLGHGAILDDYDIVILPSVGTHAGNVHLCKSLGYWVLQITSKEVQDALIQRAEEIYGGGRSKTDVNTLAVMTGAVRGGAGCHPLYAPSRCFWCHKNGTQNCDETNSFYKGISREGGSCINGAFCNWHSEYPVPFVEYPFTSFFFLDKTWYNIDERIASHVACMRMLPTTKAQQ